MNAVNKIKAIIVDDESPARLMIRNLAGNHNDVITVIAEAKSGKQAIRQINDMMPDVIFLDIDMPDMTGFDLLSKIKHQPNIIFTTAYEQYAIKAFETNSIDYLVKPIEESRFAQAILKLQRFSENGKAHFNLSQLKDFFTKLNQTRKPTAIPIKIGDRFILVRLEDVVFLEAKEKYVYIVTSDNKEHLSDTRLAEFEETLPNNFLRVQKSFIINKDRILEIHKYFGNRLIITMADKNKTRITTGITYIDKIRPAFGL